MPSTPVKKGTIYSLTSLRSLVEDGGDLVLRVPRTTL